jgi:hypothetical protein
MGKTKKEEVENIDLEFEDLPIVEVPKEPTVTKVINKEINKVSNKINPLKKGRVIVRFIPKPTAKIHNPKHVLYGGMAENATRTFVVPKLSSGMFVNVLTDSEKAYLEEIMGLEYNALSIYKKVDNFWDSSNENGISSVRLTKQDNYFDLSNPEDYIKYKILLANKNFIAPSLEAYEKAPKATYQFVIISEEDVNSTNKNRMSNTMKCYKEFGKYENDIYTLRVIVETLDGRPTSPNVKLDFLHSKINDLIQLDSRRFLSVITDEYLSTKVLIKKCIDNGLISKKADYYYISGTNDPLCEMNEDPTLECAAKYLNSPKHQDILFSFEAKLNN